MARDSLYKTLNISRDATAEEISKAYRRLALQYHPDRNPDGSEKFKSISSAYDVLNDPEKRAIYDATGIVPDQAANVDTEASAAEHSAELEAQVLQFYARYANSEEERTDVASEYKKCNGNFKTMVEEYLLFDNGKDGEIRRLRDVVLGLQKKGTIHATKEWESTSSDNFVKKIERKMLAERKEAEEALKAMGLDSVRGKSSNGHKANDNSGSLSSLQSLIQQRQKASWESMLSNVEAKYTSRSGKKNAANSESKKEKHRNEPNIEDPPRKKAKKHL